MTWHSKIRLFLIVAEIACALSALGQSTSPDPRFRNLAETVRATAAPDGGIIICGNIDYLNGENRGDLIKVDASGHAFPGFQKVVIDGWMYQVQSLPDGRILALGNFTKINGTTSSSNLIRLTSNGSLDPTFIAPHPDVQRFALQSDGKIIIYSFSGGLQRLNANGSIDGSFLSSDRGYAHVLAVTPSNHVYMISFLTLYRIRPNGTLDPDFLPITADNNMWDMSAVGENVVVVGDFNSLNGLPANRIAKLDSHGALDTNFSVDIQLTGQFTKMAMRANGSILMGGNGAVYELSPTGEFQNQLANLGPGIAWEIKELPGARILIGGRFSKLNQVARYGIALFNADYSLNDDFAPDISFCEGPIHPALVDSQGRATIIGDGPLPSNTFAGVYGGNTPVNGRVFRFNADNSFDATFVDPIYSASYQTSGAIQSDGRVVIGGSNLLFGNPFLNVIRLLEDGTLDPVFSVETGVVSYINRIRCKPGKIYIGGSFNHVNGETATSLAVLDENGNLLQAFPGVAAGTWVRDFFIQPDNKVLVHLDDGTGYSKIIRMNTDGSLDSTFPAAVFAGYVNDIAVSPDGLIYCGGAFNSVNGVPRSALVRLLPNGNIDNSFNIGSGFSPPVVNDIELLPSGIVVAGGYFSTFRNNAALAMVTINPDGTFRPSSLPTLGRTSFVRSIASYNGQLIFSGRFVSSDYQSVVGMVRASPFALVTAPSGLAGSLSTNGTVTLTWVDNSNNESGFVVERSETNQSNFQTVHAASANTTTYSEVIDRNKDYFYRIRSIGESGFSEPSSTLLIKWDTPFAPTALAASADINGQATVTWTDNSTNETGFIVERSVANQNNFLTVQTTSVNAVNYSESVNANVIYYYRVRAINAAGSSVFSSVVSLLWSAPQSPSGLAGSISASGTVTLTWSDNSINETGFAIERSADNQSNFQVVQTSIANATTFSETIDPGRIYFYRVRAVNQFGSSTSTAAISLSWDVLQSPASLTGTTAGLIITLSWNDNSSNETGFLIQRKLASESPSAFTNLGATGTDISTYMDNTIAYNKEYTYRVRAANSFGTSAFSNEVQLKTLSTPQSPANLVATISNKNISLTWSDQSNNETGFVVERQTANGGFAVINTIASNNVASFLDVAPATNTNIIYRVAAFNAAGTSGYSNTTLPQVIVGLEQASVEISVYPNPTQGHLIVSTGSIMSTATLFDAKGAQIPVAVQTIGTGQLEIDLGSLQAGLYILKINRPESVFIHKVIKY